MLGSEGEHEGPVKEPAGLLEHSHGALSESTPNHVFELADSSEFSALSGLLELDLAGEQTPEDLRNKLVVGISLSSQNFLQDEEVMVSILIFLHLEEELGVVEEILAVVNGDLVLALVELLEVELTLFAHFVDCAAIRKECYEFPGILLSYDEHFAGFLLVSTDKFGLNIVLEGLAILSDVALQEEEE